MSMWQIQSRRFIVVGIVTNLALYLIYILLTTLAVGHKSAMTLLYFSGAMQSFVFNRKWTFSYSGNTQACLLRYLIAYGSGYILNFSFLFIFVDCLGWSHEIVQGSSVIIVAALMFIAQKYWVFSGNSGRSKQGGEIA